MAQINTILSIFLMLILGYVAKKCKVLKQEDVGLINKIILLICLPAFIINVVIGAKLSLAMFVTPIVAIVCKIIVLCIAFFICKLFKFNKELTLAIMFCSVFGNTGFLGYPVVTSFFSDKLALPAAVMYDQFGMQFFFLISAPIIASIVIGGGAGTGFNKKIIIDILKKPVTIALTLALIFHNYTPPAFFMLASKHVGNAIVPLAMISIGLNLKASSALKYIKPILIVLVLKLALLPLFVYFAIKLVGISGVVAQVVILQTSLATAVLSGILTNEYKGDSAFASAAIFATTTVDIVMIPIVASLLGIG